MYQRAVRPAGPSSDPDANGAVGEHRATDSDTVFKFATQYKFTPTDGVRAVQRGVPPRRKNSQRAAETGLVPLEYKPDTLENYEVGLKSHWFDNRLQLNVSVF